MLYETNCLSKEGGEGKHSYKDLVSDFLLIFVGGSETTSRFLVMAIYYVCANEEVKAKLEEELKDINLEEIDYVSIAKYKYLEAVFMEVSRIYGPGNAIQYRECLRDNKIGDLLIKKGTLVNIGNMFNQFSPKYFDEPMKFKPERWFGEEAENLKKLPYVFLPYSAGKRNCIGQHFAILQDKLTLVYLLQNYELKMPPGYEMRITRNLIREPVVPLKLLMKKKNFE